MGGHFGHFEVSWDLLRHIGGQKVAKKGDEESSRGPKRPQEGPGGSLSGGEGAQNAPQMVPKLAQEGSKRRLEREKPKPSKMSSILTEKFDFGRWRIRN